MVKEAIDAVAGALRANLQAALDALAAGVTIEQIIDPFTTDTLELNNHPGVIVSMAPFKSPSAEFRVFDKADVHVPIIIEYETRERDTGEARGSVSAVQRAILHVLNDLTVAPPMSNNTQLLELTDLEFDFIRHDGDATGAAVYVTAIMRDIAP